MIDTSAFQGKKAAYYTLGCKLNFSETSTFGKTLADMGVITAAKGEQADICLINTCSVTEVAPINAMGITKAIEEKIAVAKSRYSGDTKICCTRYGNVMCSRGSVIPLWIDQIRNGNPITLTEPKMTRFIMSLEEAVDLDRKSVV